MGNRLTVILRGCLTTAVLLAALYGMLSVGRSANDIASVAELPVAIFTGVVGIGLIVRGWQASLKILFIIFCALGIASYTFESSFAIFGLPPIPQFIAFAVWTIAWAFPVFVVLLLGKGGVDAMHLTLTGFSAIWILAKVGYQDDLYAVLAPPLLALLSVFLAVRLLNYYRMASVDLSECCSRY